MSFAIVSMVRNLDGSFHTWLQHHISQGCTHFYIIFDAPDEDQESIKAANSFASSSVTITIIENTSDHRKKLMEYEPELATQVERQNHVVRRQILNVSWVLRLAIEAQVEWLLHIDSDELLNPYIHEINAADYFASVDSKYDEVIFPNFEAVPEKHNIENPFTDIQLFRKSLYYLSYQEFEHLFTGWNGRTGSYKLFNSYVTGKSAIRMRDVDVAFIPYSVHHFLPVRFANNILIEDQGGPAIFHYPNCGLDRFLARFTGSNTNRINTYEEASYEKQDLYGRAQALAQENNIEGLKALYEELIMISNPKLAGYLSERNFLIRKDLGLGG